MQEDQMRQEIVKRLGVEALPQEEQDKLIDQVNEAILARVMYETMESLSEENVEILKQKMEDESSSAEDVDLFLRSNIENYDEFLKNIVDTFFEEMEKSIEDSDLEV